MPDIGYTGLYCMAEIGESQGPKALCRICRIIGYAGVGYAGYYCIWVAFDVIRAGFDYIWQAQNLLWQARVIWAGFDLILAGFDLIWVGLKNVFAFGQVLILFGQT